MPATCLEGLVLDGGGNVFAGRDFYDEAVSQYVSIGKTSADASVLEPNIFLTKKT